MWMTPFIHLVCFLLIYLCSLACECCLLFICFVYWPQALALCLCIPGCECHSLFIWIAVFWSLLLYFCSPACGWWPLLVIFVTCWFFSHSVFAHQLVSAFTHFFLFAICWLLFCSVVLGCKCCPLIILLAYCWFCWPLSCCLCLSAREDCFTFVLFIICWPLLLYSSLSACECCSLFIPFTIFSPLSCSVSAWQHVSVISYFILIATW